MSTLIGLAPRWLLVAGFATAAAAVNVLLAFGATVGEQTMMLAFAVGILPAALIAFGALVESHRALLAWAALAITFTSIPLLVQPLPVPGGTNIFLPDILVLLAVGAWLASRLSSIEPGNPVRLSPAFGWPFVVFGGTVLAGILIGNERYGASIIGQPLRLVLYAGIALALTDIGISQAWRAITIIFYAGAVVQAMWAAYYLVSGTSQTASAVLTTGGVRVLALSAAMYLTGSLVCALLNLELEKRPERQFLHVGIAVLALFGIVVSFGRTTYAAVVLIVPLLLLTRRSLGRTVLVLAPLLVAPVILAAFVVSVAVPTIGPTLQARLSGTSTSDSAVVWRERARESVMEGVDDEWLTGVGFGRTTQFTMQGQVIRVEGDPHNSYIWLLAGGGLLALGSFLVICATFVVDAYRRLRQADPHGQALVVWALATWFAFMVNALTGPILSDPRLVISIWVLMALPSLVARVPRSAHA